MKFRMRDDRDISDEPIHQLPTRKRFRDILSNGEDLDKVPGTDGFECTVHKSLGSSQSHKPNAYFVIVGLIQQAGYEC